MGKAFPSGSGTDERPPSLPNGVPVGKVPPPPQTACYLEENLWSIFLLFTC